MIGWFWSVDGEIYCMVVRDCLFATIQFLLYFCYIYLLAVYINYYCINISFFFLLTFIRLKLILPIQVSETAFFLIILIFFIFCNLA